MQTKSTMRALDIKILWWRLAFVGRLASYPSFRIHGSSTHVMLERYIMFLHHIYIYKIYIDSNNTSIQIVYQFVICIRSRCLHSIK